MLTPDKTHTVTIGGKSLVISRKIILDSARANKEQHRIESDQERENFRPKKPWNHYRRDRHHHPADPADDPAFCHRSRSPPVRSERAGSARFVGDHLKNEVNFSVSTANNFMRVFKEFGDDQMPLFGDAKSQTFGNLTYSQAVALFAVPKEERENFVAENNAADLSVAELKKLIAERDKQLSEAQGQNKSATDSITQLKTELDALKAKSGKVSAEELKALQKQAEEAARAKANEELQKIQAATAAETAKALEKQQQLEQQLQASRENAKAEADKALATEKARILQLEEQLKAAQSSEKTVSENAVAAERKKIAELEEKLKSAKDAAKSATDKAVTAEKQKVKALEEKLKQVESSDAAAAAELKAAQSRAVELEKKLKLADTDTTVFSVHFEDLQACINKLNGLVLKMEKGEQKETAAKLKGAFKAVLTAAIEKL